MKRFEKVAFATSLLVAAMVAAPVNAEIVRLIGGGIIDTNKLTPMPINKSKLNAKTLEFVEEVEAIEAKYNYNWPNPARLLKCRPAYWEHRFMPPPYNKYIGADVPGMNSQAVCDF